MKRILLLLVLVMFGCATYPAPRVDNGVYINEEYEIKLTIPDGWKASEEFPVELTGGDEGAIKLYAFNENEYGHLFLFLSSGKLKKSITSKADYYSIAWESLKSTPGLTLGDLEDRGEYALSFGSAAVGDLKFCVGTRMGIYDCQDRKCTYGLVNYTLQAKADRNRRTLEGIAVTTK